MIWIPWDLGVLMALVHFNINIFMETNKEITYVVYYSIEKMSKSFGGTEVKLLSEKMYRTSPNRYKSIGCLGVDIEVMNIKTFLSYEMVEDIAYTPYGQIISDEFIARIIKEGTNRK